MHNYLKVVLCNVHEELTRAIDAPAMVIPGRAGVPVIINGGDASFCVVEGDWGLARPGMPVTVVACPPQRPIPSYELPYFPALGRRPGYGRLEVEPPPVGIAIGSSAGERRRAACQCRSHGRAGGRAAPAPGAASGLRFAGLKAR